MRVSLHYWVSVLLVLRGWKLVGVSMYRIHSPVFGQIEKGKVTGAGVLRDSGTRRGVGVGVGKLKEGLSLVFFSHSPAPS